MTADTFAIESLSLLHQGKVRHLYEIDADYLLMVNSDRISAFDVILPTPIPGKGEILMTISTFWLNTIGSKIPNQMTQYTLDDVLSMAEITPALRRRSMVIKRTQPLSFEAIVRGYLAGSGWQDYQTDQSVCGIQLPTGIRLAEHLPKPIFTPSTKAEIGTHDVNVNFSDMVSAVGTDMANTVKQTALQLYTEAARYAEKRGIIIADTKFEFGIDKQGDLLLIDEVLTPDSSRFWPKDSYVVGTSPISFDKQFIRDYLTTLPWDRSSPPPILPPDIVQKTLKKYQQAELTLTRSPS